MSRTDEQIVHETNDLARLLLAELVGTGYQAPVDHKFWEAPDPRSQKAWNAAVKVMELVTKTEVADALSNYLDECGERVNLYSTDFHLCATVYVKAKTLTEAKALFQKLNDTELSVIEDLHGSVAITGMSYERPDMPVISLSPAMTIHITQDDADSLELHSINLPAGEAA